MQRLSHSWMIPATCLFAIASARASSGITVAPPASPPAVYVPSEWSVDTGRSYQNPYEPNQIAVDATFTDASGRTLVQPAYWRPARGGGVAGFCVRFAADKPGRWTVRVDAVDPAGKRTSESQSFEVHASDTPGPLRVAGNRRYLRYDNGATFFPIGINLAWPPGEERAAWYDRTFATLAENGGNFARVWMAHGPVMIESGKTGLTRFDDANAHYFDEILEAAARHGIQVMLCMVNHREFLVRDQWGDAGWPTSPYSSANGGPATRPADFFTSPVARDAFKARLRYQVARYAAYPGLGFWELFNEQEFTPTPVPTEWNGEMMRYLAEIDPYRHLTTTSAHLPPDTYTLPQMAITQAHLYGDGNTFDLVPAVTSAVADHEQYAKPVLIAEAGIDSNGPDTKYDPNGSGTAFHNEIWSAAMSGSCGGAQYWWWDSYVEPKKLWPVFKPLAEFTRQIDFAGRNFQPIEMPGLRHANASGRSAMTIPASGGWGATAPHATILIPPNGRPTKGLPAYFCGPSHAELNVPIDLSVDLPAESKVTVNAATVSDYALLRVAVDGKPLGELLFSATPGSPGAGDTTWNPEAHGYRGPVSGAQSLPVPVSAGKHRVTITCLAGDWVTLTGLTFSDALDNHYSNLAVLALQDTASKETAAWIYDPRSTWKNDLDGNTPAVLNDVTLDVPNLTDGAWVATWHDTRKGGVLRSDRVKAVGGKLVLNVPPFARDVALRVTRAR